jgi:ATPase subunit of ABC transporter with duplicated ATPase domains
MAAFDGTVIAVVHDRYFIKRFATRLWVIRDGMLHTYFDLEDYRRARERWNPALTDHEPAGG